MLDALQPIVAAQCAWLFSCCNTFERAYDLGPLVDNEQDCVEHVLQDLSSAETASGVPTRFPSVLRAAVAVAFGPLDVHVKADGSAVASCAKQLRAVACEARIPVDHCEPSAPTSTHACQVEHVLPGLGHEGSACLNEAAGALGCGPHTRCSSRVGAGPLGYCVATRAAGARCQHDIDCDAGLLCDYATGSCVSGVGYGQACAFSDDDDRIPGTERVRCAAGLACDAATVRCEDGRCYEGMTCSTRADCPAGLTCRSSRCLPAAASGAVCSGNDECKSKLCTADPSSGIGHCSDGLALQKPCASDDACKSGFCDLNAGAYGSCLPPQEVAGAQCPSLRDTECATGKCQFTVNGYVCTPTGERGSSCLVDSDCVFHKGLGCDGGSCGPVARAQDKACLSDAQCQSHTCRAGVCVGSGVLGAKCSSDPTFCEPGLYCDTSKIGKPAKCQAKKGQGEPCTSADECWSSCGAVFGARVCSSEGARVASCVGPTL